MAKKNTPNKKSKKTKSDLDLAEAKRERNFIRTSRPLAGRVLGISISESDDIEDYGYGSWDVNRITVRLCEALLNAGAHLVFGHDWRPDGIMTAICGIAIKSHSTADSELPPLIQNFLAHPDKTSISDQLKRDLRQRDLVRIRTVDPPRVNGGLDPDLQRALALSRMRFRMNLEVDARICLGGKRLSQSSAIPAGFYSGVAEEAYWAAVTGKPLLVGGFLGGVSHELIESLSSETVVGEHLGIDSLAVVEQKTELHEKAVAMFKDREFEEFEMPPADLKPVFETDKLNDATNGLWNKGCEAEDVDAFAAIVRQLKF